jgi:hypothetical protein
VAVRVLLAGHVQRPLVRQSRFLWLRVPGARAEVLKLVERMVARLYARVAVAIVAFVLFALWVLGTPLGEAAWGVALMGTAALYSACLGLAAVRNVWLMVVGVSLMFIVQVTVLAALAEPPSAPQLAATVFFRALAARRWRDIDWLKFKPARFGRSELSAR